MSWFFWLFVGFVAGCVATTLAIRLLRRKTVGELIEGEKGADAAVGDVSSGG